MATKLSNKNIKTYADYKKLKEGEPYQLINGMLVKSPSPTANHQRVIKRIAFKFMELEEKGLGEMLFAPMDVYLSEIEVYQPDIIFVSEERLSIIEEKKINGPPDIVIEVLSPTSGYYDLRHKMKTYESFGVKEYWIIDPMEKTIRLYYNGESGFRPTDKAGKETGGDCSVQSKLFPQFRIERRELFDKKEARA